MPDSLSDTEWPTRLFRYRCVTCEHVLFLGDDSEDTPTCCPFCGSMEVWSDGHIDHPERADGPQPPSDSQPDLPLTWRCDSCGHVAPGPPDACPACDVGWLGSWTGVRSV